MRQCTVVCSNLSRGSASCCISSMKRSPCWRRLWRLPCHSDRTGEGLPVPQAAMTKMQNRQLNLFADNQRNLPLPRSNFDREKWFLAPHPSEWQAREYERALEFVRASLPVILESFRGTDTFPWQAKELRALRIIFHNRSSWLPPEECEVFRQAFRDELARWEEAGQLPEHEAIDPALLTRRSEPPALDCPAAEWEVAGISPIVDDDTGVYGKLRPLPLDQDTYVLWPSMFEPRTIAPLPSGVPRERPESSRDGR